MYQDHIERLISDEEAKAEKDLDVLKKYKEDLEELEHAREQIDHQEIHDSKIMDSFNEDSSDESSEEEKDEEEKKMDAMEAADKARRLKEK